MTSKEIIKNEWICSYILQIREISDCFSLTYHLSKAFDAGYHVKEQQMKDQIFCENCYQYIPPRQITTLGDNHFCPLCHEQLVFLNYYDKELLKKREQENGN